MTDPQRVPELRFEPPGPGSWELDPVHFPRPATRYWTEMHPAAFRRGTSEFARSYGMLIDALEIAYVNGFAYKLVKPAPEAELPERFQRAEEVFQRKYWREQLRDWNETFKPTSIRAHRDLQSVDPDGLSDDALVMHLTRCREHHAQMIYQHMRFTAAAIVPTGDFLAHVGDWTGLEPAELLGLMRGTSPVSAGASAQLEQLITAIRQDPRAQQLLESEDDPGRMLEALRSLDGGTGAAMSAYLDLVGYRLLDGFDISNPFALELPDVLRRAIRAAAGGTGADVSDAEGKIADVRGKVPEQHRAQFDELLEEARLTYPIRDERGVFSDIWASGLMRRAALAGGRRLADKGRIHDAAHFVDAGLEEMRALLSGADGPSADELAERFEYRTSHSAKDAPLTLGPPPPPPPDPSGSPRLASLRVRPDHAGRRPRHRIDDRSVQYPSAVARGYRDGQRRPTLPLGDRRARVRDPGCGRDARGDGAYRRWGAGACRRRCRRGHGARVKRVVPLEEAVDDT